MAKIIRPNLVNTVRSSEISAMLRWGALFAVLLAGAVGLLLAKQYLPAAVCILILPIALPLAKKQIGVIRAGADGEAETLRLLRKQPADWTVIPDAVIEYRGHRSQTDYILIAPAGVLILEALAQTGAVAILSLPENKGKLAFFGGIKNAKFRKQVIPGDRLRLETEIIKCKGPMGIGKAVATVDGKLAAEAEISFMCTDAK